MESQFFLNKFSGSSKSLLTEEKDTHTYIIFFGYVYPTDSQKIINMAHLSYKTGLKLNVLQINMLFLILLLFILNRVREDKISVL